MAHELEVQNGRIEAAFALNPAWHNLGVTLDYVPNSEQMIKAAGLDWKVEMLPLQSHCGKPCGEFVGEDFKGKHGTFRQDNGYFLGAVSDAYSVVQNHEPFAFLDGLLQDGIMKYESAFALRGGRQIVVLARIPGVADEIADGDASYRYICFTTSHDGTARMHIIPTAVRVVCANTLRVALGNSHDIGYNHVGNMQAKMNEAHKMISQINAEFDGFRDHSRQLAKIPYNTEMYKAIMSELFPAPLPDESGMISKKAVTHYNKRLAAIEANLHNPRNALPSIDGTVWSLYNAISEYNIHGRRYNGSEREKAENRFIQTVDGRQAESNEQAFAVCSRYAGLELAAN